MLNSVELKNNSSIRLAGCLLTFIVLITSSVYVYVLRQKSIDDWTKRTENLSLILAEHSGQVMFSANTALDSIIDLLKIEHLKSDVSYAQFASSRELHQALLDKTKTNPLIDVATFVDRDGNVINFTRSFPAPDINLSNRDYFQWLSKNKSNATYYSVPVQNKGNGNWVFYLARRVNDKNNNFIGLALVGVSAKVFSTLYQRIGMDMGKGVDLALYRNDITLLTSWPYADSMIGKKNTNLTFVQALNNGVMNGDAFISDSPSNFDNNTSIKRMISLQSVEQYPLFVGVSVQERLYLDGWLTAAAGIFLSAILTLIVLLYGIRLLHKSYKFNSEIQYIAMHDALTRLPNRHLFEDRFANVIALAKRENIKFAVLFIDLNNFKMINDNNTHAMGDLVLKEVAASMSRCIRVSDTLARVGGDEFMVLLPNLKNKDDIAHVIKKIHQSLRSDITILNKHIEMSASIGFSVYPEDGLTESELSTHADQAMYRDKQNKNNNE